MIRDLSNWRYINIPESSTRDSGAVFAPAFAAEIFPLLLPADPAQLVSVCDLPDGRGGGCGAFLDLFGGVVREHAAFYVAAADFSQAAAGAAKGVDATAAADLAAVFGAGADSSLLVRSGAVAFEDVVVTPGGQDVESAARLRKIRDVPVGTEILDGHTLIGGGSDAFCTFPIETSNWAGDDQERSLEQRT